MSTRPISRSARSEALAPATEDGDDTDIFNRATRCGGQSALGSGDPTPYIDLNSDMKLSYRLCRKTMERTRTGSGGMAVPTPVAACRWRQPARWTDGSRYPWLLRQPMDEPPHAAFTGPPELTGAHRYSASARTVEKPGLSSYATTTDTAWPGAPRRALVWC